MLFCFVSPLIRSLAEGCSLGFLGADTLQIAFDVESPSFPARSNRCPSMCVCVWVGVSCCLWGYACFGDFKGNPPGKSSLGVPRCWLFVLKGNPPKNKKQGWFSPKKGVVLPWCPFQTPLNPRSTPKIPAEPGVLQPQLRGALCGRLLLVFELLAGGVAVPGERLAAREVVSEEKPRGSGTP